MTKSKDWGRNDPQDSQVMALRTKVDKLEGKKIGLNKEGGGSGSKNSSLTKSTFKYTINPERMEKVGPTKSLMDY